VGGSLKIFEERWCCLDQKTISGGREERGENRTSLYLNDGVRRARGKKNVRDPLQALAYWSGLGECEKKRDGGLGASELLTERGRNSAGKKSQDAQERKEEGVILGGGVSCREVLGMTDPLDGAQN